MKKLVAFALAAFAIKASAFALTGNDSIDDARAYLSVEENGGRGTSEQLQQWNMWIGTVRGLSAVFAEYSYRYSICYPEGAKAGQLAEIAANYLIKNPKDRQKSLNLLVWESQREAYGLMSTKTCYLHDKWLEVQSTFK